MKLSKRTICLLLCFAMSASLLSGCRSYETPRETTAETTAETEAATVDTAPSAAGNRPLTLCFSSSDSINPFTATNLYNCALDSLLFEGLVRVDEDYSVQNVLCDSVSTTDGLTYVIHVASGIAMHDGSTLTADDVVYSIQAAAASEKYKARFANLTSVAVSGELTVTAVLNSVNFGFSALLDIPIVKSGTGGDDVPVGSGPYVYSAADGAYSLTAFSGYRGYASLQKNEIALSDLEFSATANAFTDGSLDFLVSDPTDTGTYYLKYSCDTKYFGTSVLQYLGFNTEKAVVNKSEFRRALYLLIDRQSLISSVMDGHALAAPVIFSPEASFYSDTFESGKDPSAASATSILTALGYVDKDGDGMYKTPEGASFSLIFIVNSGNKYKTEAARAIADTLIAAGISVDLQILSWTDYQAALAAGNYDLYYGEVRLTNDFDLTCLFGTGGAVNYGKIADANLTSLSAAFLASSTNEAKTAAAGALSDAIYQSSAVIPLWYKQYCVITRRNFVTEVSPVYGSIYGNIAQWQFSQG